MNEPLVFPAFLIDMLTGGTIVLDVCDLFTNARFSPTSEIYSINP